MTSSVTLGTSMIRMLEKNYNKDDFALLGNNISLCQHKMDNRRPRKDRKKLVSKRLNYIGLELYLINNMVPLPHNYNGNINLAQVYVLTAVA